MQARRYGGFSNRLCESYLKRSRKLLGLTFETSGSSMEANGDEVCEGSEACCPELSTAADLPDRRTPPKLEDRDGQPLPSTLVSRWMTHTDRLQHRIHSFRFALSRVELSRGASARRSALGTIRIIIQDLIPDVSLFKI